MAAVLTERSRLLDAYLERQLALAWAWGMVDCCMFAADWIVAARGRDPAGAWRGAYDSAEGAQRLVFSAGGLIAAIAPRMQEAGFVRTSEPVEGDVGIVRAPVTLRGGGTEARPVAAICGRGGLWIVRALDGLQWRALPLLAAWRV